MIAQRTPATSAILAATGRAGMESAGAERFWDWRRITLAVGYALIFGVGALILLTADPTGLTLMAAAVLGVLFIHRTWLGLSVWLYVLAAGLLAIFSSDDLGAWGVLAGVGFGIVALPIWHARRRAPSTASYWMQSPFPPLPARPISAAEPALEPASDRLPVPEAVPAAGPSLRTIGRIQLMTSAGDVTAGLIGKPVIGFLWLYLLARSVRHDGDRLLRSSITDEVAHGVSDPRGRLRGYLRDLSRLPLPFGSMVKVDEELIGFDLGTCDADFVRLREVALSLRQATGQLDDNSLRAAQLVLQELGDGEFLPGFDDIEKRATAGRGVAGQLVAEVRSQIDTLRSDVADVVGKALLDRGQASLAVSLLEPIVARSEERDDLARTLVNALRESGQHARAAEIRRRFAVGQES